MLLKDWILSASVYMAMMSERHTDWENLKGHVQQAVYKGSIEGYACDHRLRDKHVDGSGEMLGHDRLDIDLDILMRMVVSRVACFFA